LGVKLIVPMSEKLSEWGKGGGYNQKQKRSYLGAGKSRFRDARGNLGGQTKKEGGKVLKRSGKDGGIISERGKKTMVPPRSIEKWKGRWEGTGTLKEVSGGQHFWVKCINARKGEVWGSLHTREAETRLEDKNKRRGVIGALGRR